MSTADLYMTTGIAAIVVAAALGFGGWHRRQMSTPAARALAVSLALWFARYGVRVYDSADGKFGAAGQIAGNTRVLAFSTVLLALSALTYAVERRSA